MTRKLIVPFLMAALPCTPAAASVVTLDFANTNCATTCKNGSSFLQSYGDQAGLDVSYRSLTGTGNAPEQYSGLRYWDNFYGDLNGIVWGGNGDSNGSPEITFTLTAPGTIQLNSLDYAGWTVARTTDFRIYDLGYNLLFASGPLNAPAFGHGSITFPTISSTSGLRLQWGPNGFNAGIDNLKFSLNEVTASVPEPTTWMMMILGFGAAGVFMRRRPRKAARLA